MISESSRLSVNLVAQPSRLRVAAASRRQHEHRAGRPVNSQARTPALHPQGSSRSQCMRKKRKRALHELPIHRITVKIPHTRNQSRVAFRRTPMSAPVCSQISENKLTVEGGRDVSSVRKV